MHHEEDCINGYRPFMMSTSSVYASFFNRGRPVGKSARRSGALGHFAAMVWNSLVDLARIRTASHCCLHFAPIGPVKASRSVNSTFHFKFAANTLVENNLI